MAAKIYAIVLLQPAGAFEQKSVMEGTNLSKSDGIDENEEDVESVSWEVDGTIIDTDPLKSEAGTYQVKYTIEKNDGSIVQKTKSVPVEPPDVYVPAKFYYLTDHPSTTRVVVDANGNVVEAYDFFPACAEFVEALE